MQKFISPPLFAHQVNFLKENPDKTTLVHSCGTGKTRTAIEWAKLDEHPPLIICPKALKTNWHREAVRWGLKDFAILTKEEFRRDFKDLPRFGQIIVDEVHNGFLTPMFKSQMSKALKAYLRVHEVGRVLLLSATVYTSSPWNIFNLAHYTGHKWNFVRFDKEFFYHIKMGHRMIPQPKRGMEAKLAEMTKKIASVVDINDVMDVPEQNHTEPEVFQLSKEQERLIDDNYDPIAIVRYTKQHEIENGILIGNEFQPTEFFLSDKHERILSIVEENKKVAIVCRYNAQIDQLLGLLNVYEPLVIRGDVKDRDAVTLAAEAAERCVVLIQADCAEGYQLPSFGVCVFASMSYAYTKFEQICGRFLRMDKPSPTTFIYLLTDGPSIDRAVYDSIKRKEDFQIELYAKSL